VFTPHLDSLLLFLVALPGVGLLAHRIKQRYLVEVYTLLGFTVPFYFVWKSITELGTDTIVVYPSLPSSVIPNTVIFVIDAFSLFMTLIYLSIGLVIVLYSLTYFPEESPRPGYYALLLGLTVGMIGVVLSGSLFTLFIFWEIMSLCSYILVAFHTTRWEPIEAGYKYLIMSGTGGVTTLFGMTWLYGLTGTLNIATLFTAFQTAPSDPWLLLPLALILCGFGLQAGMFPFHFWLPDAHSAAPTPVSALLSGVMVMTGVYALIRVLHLVFPPLISAWTTTLAIFAIVTMFVGNVMALLQTDVKRLLAYSTVANVGYILLGVALNNLEGLTGSLFQILNHAIVKSLLFFCAGTFDNCIGTRNLHQLGGVGRRMPVTTSLFLLGVLALAGLPPLNLFWSEWAILAAGITAERFEFSLLMILNMTLSAAYCLRILQHILRGDASTLITPNIREPPRRTLVPIMLLAGTLVLIGLFPGPFYIFAEEAAHAALNLQAYVHAILP
jgi:proton-translocating NADH-quinone oxidoreductase chain N